MYAVHARGFLNFSGCAGEHKAEDEAASDDESYSSSGDLVDFSASQTQGQTTTPVTTHLRSHRVSTGAASSADSRGDRTMATGAVHTNSQGQADDVAADSSSDEDEDASFPAAQQAQELTPVDHASPSVIANSISAPVPTVVIGGTTAAAAVATQTQSGGGMAGAARVLLAARKWRRTVVPLPSVPTVPEDRALTMSTSSLSESVDGTGSDSTTPNACATPKVSAAVVILPS